MKKCCLFDLNASEFKENREFETVKDYGEIDSPNQCKRKLKKCKKCGALFLYQFLDWNDRYYDDYIQVDSESTADEFNNKLSFSNFGVIDSPMIKIGSDNKVQYILNNKEKEMEDRENLIMETLKKEGREGLKKINVTPDEIDEVVNSIDKKIRMLNMEGTLAVSKELDYNLPIDYCVFYSKQMNLHIKPNLFKINGKEKVINTLLSMDKDSKNFILNLQVSDSQYKDRLVTFALLELGDSLCFDRNDNSIVYYNHELDEIEKLANSWEEFEGMLYE